MEMFGSIDVALLRETDCRQTCARVSNRSEIGQRKNGRAVLKIVKVGSLKTTAMRRVAQCKSGVL
jgi:hypothetical protein